MRGFLQNSYFSVYLHKMVISAPHLRNGKDKEPAGISLSLGNKWKLVMVQCLDC